MPWTADQMKVIQARAHGWKKGKAFAGISEEKARSMAKEGIKRGTKKSKKPGRGSHRMPGGQMMMGGTHAQAEELARGGK